VQPTVVALRAKTRAVLMAELERSLGGRLNHLAERDRAALTQMMESAVNKLHHAPTTRLKAATASDDVGDLVNALKHLFDLPLHDMQGHAPESKTADGARSAPPPTAEDDDRVTH
jgi:glutamyl-tRNA reductase